MKYRVDYTNRFKRDFRIAEKRGKDMEKLRRVILELAEGHVLDPSFRDHKLSGVYDGCRECHIEPDWLLVYEILDDVLVLVLNRTGTHSDGRGVPGGADLVFQVSCSLNLERKEVMQ